MNFFSVYFTGEQNPKNPQLAKIKLVIYKKGYPRVEKVLPISGSFKDWDKTAKRFKATSKENANLNIRLSEIHKQYIQLAEQWQNENIEWEPVHLSHFFENPKNLVPSEQKIMTVSQVYDKRIEKFQNEQRIRAGEEMTRKSYAQRFLYHKRMLQNFVRERFGRDFSTYFFNEIDESFLKALVFDIEKKAIQNGNNGGMHDKLFCLYKIVQDATKLHIRGANLEVFECVADKYKSKESEPRTIPYKTFLMIENFDRSLLSKKEQELLDMYLFCFYCGGMAPVDSVFLRWSSIDLKSKAMCFERMKTGKIARPVFHIKAQEIADRYKSKCFRHHLPAKEVVMLRLTSRLSVAEVCPCRRRIWASASRRRNFNVSLMKRPNNI